MNVEFELVSCEEWIGWSKKGKFEGLGVSKKKKKKKKNYYLKYLLLIIFLNVCEIYINKYLIFIG